MSKSNVAKPRVDYHEYIKSPKWYENRKVALKRAGKRCQLCASRTQLDVHHNSYKNLGDEEPWDLVVLCRRCHDAHHAVADPRTMHKAEERGFDVAGYKGALPPIPIDRGLPKPFTTVVCPKPKIPDVAPQRGNREFTNAECRYVASKWGQPGWATALAKEFGCSTKHIKQIARREQARMSGRLQHHVKLPIPLDL